MSIAGVAVDCGWLMEQHAASHEDNFSVMQAFQYMREHDMNVLIDHEGKILAEYERNLLPNTFGKKLLTHLMKLKMLYSVSGVADQKCSSCLDAIVFDPSDRPYVAVAQHGRGAYLTHETKHHEPTRVAKVDTKCHVPILDTRGFTGLMS